ncbi:MAG TPA: MBL fold metallo-hydrolase, partial [Candidatus Coprenecus stercorigallinarum]|nr:MBL fold metallo-hydrolase [Candidatus Coprenecus stercorigallinarum]
EESIELFRGVDIFVVSCIRRTPHISHFSLGEALEVCRKVGARHSFLTHLSHQLECYSELCKALPEGVEPAYDGLSLVF